MRTRLPAPATLLGRSAIATLGAVLVVAACGDTPRDVDDDDGGDGSGAASNNITVSNGNGGSNSTASMGTGANSGGEPGSLNGITAAHNQVRQQADPSIPNLEWNETVAGVAQAYADQLASQGCPLQHSDSSYGENLFWGSGSYSPAEVVGAWADEISCYTHTTFPDACGCTCGHYTQIVWRESTQVGCGIGACPDGGEVWVCNYDPPGNYIGQMAY